KNDRLAAGPQNTGSAIEQNHAVTSRAIRHGGELYTPSRSERHARAVAIRQNCTRSRRRSQVARQWSAKPRSAVRIRPSPPSLHVATTCAGTNGDHVIGLGTLDLLLSVFYSALFLLVLLSSYR